MCGESSTTNNTSSNTWLPSYLSGDSQTVANNATQQIQNNPYQGYTGPTQGAMGPTFGTAEDAATSQLQNGNSNFDAGGSALNTLLGVDANNATKSVSDYMSPDIAATLTPTLRAINTTAAGQSNNLAQAATMAGAFGDTGYGNQKQELNYNTQQNVGDATANAYNTAYNNALTSQNNALSQLTSGVGAATSLGSAQTGNQTTLDSLLGSLGSTQQQANQTGINTAINVNNQNQLGQLGLDQAATGVLGGLPHDSSTYGSSTTTQPDNTGLGLLGSLASSI